jgi:hypothetical protein
MVNRSSYMFSLARVSSAVALSMSFRAADARLAHAQTATHAESASPSVSKSAHHLQVASDLLARVPDPAHEDAAERLADLRYHYAAMVALYQAESPRTSPMPAAGGDGKPTDGDGKPTDWTDRFSDVERHLTKILGSGTPLGPPTGIPVAPATASGVLEVDPRGTLPPHETAGPKTQKAEAAPVPLRPAADFPGADLFAIATAKAGPVGFRDLDHQVREVLEQFRVELELFYTSAISEGSPGRQKPASS